MSDVRIQSRAEKKALEIFQSSTERSSTLTIQNIMGLKRRRPDGRERKKAGESSEGTIGGSIGGKAGLASLLTPYTIGLVVIGEWLSVCAYRIMFMRFVM